MTPFRLLPCKHCVGRGAMLPPSKANPNGEPYLTTGYVSSYKCFRCKRLQSLSLKDYRVLPRLTFDEVVSLAKKFQAPEIVWRLITDMQGRMELTEEQCRDLVRAGIDLAEAVMLSRDPVDGSQSSQVVDESGMIDSQAVEVGPPEAGRKDAAVSESPSGDSGVSV
jgi:hypothetical protein